MEFRFGSVVYESVWNAIVGENLPCVAEPSNTADRYAVAVTKNGTIVGHVSIF